MLLEFGAGLAGNLVAGWIQQDAWQNLFTPIRLAGTAAGAVLMLVVIAWLEGERHLAWNWRWHGYWYLRALTKSPQLRRWETEFAPLKLAHGRRPPVMAEVVAEGERQDMVALLRHLVLAQERTAPRALVLGEPGSGKTTGMERLTWEVARQGVRRLGRGTPMPVLLRLGNYQAGSLMEFAAEEVRHVAGGHSGKVISRGLATLLEKGHVALLCDALDEALGDRRDLVLAEIARLLTSRLYDKVAVVITARTREDPGNRLHPLQPFTIQDLNDEAVRAFVQVYRRQGDDETEVLARLERAGLLEPGGLGRNPFWLQLVVESRAFQGRKGQILNQALDTLLAREWDKPAIKRAGWERVLPREEQLAETRGALARLAYQMSEAGLVAMDYDGVVQDILQPWLAQRSSAGRLRPADVVGLGRDAQLLVYWPGPLRFRHRLLQEALTAWVLARNKALCREAIEQHAAETAWWETLLMLADLTDDSAGLVVAVLGDGRSEQRLFLASGMLQSGGQPEPEMRKKMGAALEISLSGGVTANHKAAVVALAQIVREDVMALLTGLLSTDNPLLRQAARVLLTELVGLDELRGMLQENDVSRQWLGLRILSTRNDTVIQDVLARAPANRRVLYEAVLGQASEPRPGAGIVIHNGQWLPDVAWGKVVPAGSYAIGGGQNAPWSSFGPKEVAIERPFQLARYPITYAQFQCFVTAADFFDPRWWAEMPAEEKAYGSVYRLRELSEQAFKFWNYPRERVSWYQAIAFSRWLRDKLGEEIDLPHEYEWEVAARYPDGRRYPWGDKFDKKKANTGESRIGQTTAAGRFPAGRNPALDLYDLSGNVWEWCRNKYKNPEDTAVDKSGAWRGLRGGSWDFARRAALAAASRDDLLLPFFRFGLVGFRL
ncbi:MAG: SUMF1/EgtB/PvdO family nonheme iron enzyme, partial [Chloroflexota bacterium]